MTTTVNFSSRSNEFKTFLESIIRDIVKDKGSLLKNRDIAEIASGLDVKRSTISKVVKSGSVSSRIVENIVERIDSKEVVERLLFILLDPLVDSSVDQVNTPIGQFRKKIRGGYETKSGLTGKKVSVPVRTTVGFAPSVKVKRSVNE